MTDDKNCPNCGNQLSFVSNQTDIEHEVGIEEYVCDECGIQVKFLNINPDNAKLTNDFVAH